MGHSTAEGASWARQAKAEQGKLGHVMSCLARGVSPLYRKDKETHLIYREKEIGHGMGRGKARAGARQPKAEQGKRYSM